ncbi:MAG: thioredoxin family protein [Acidobacteria bacterium]|nr:thioredoxin family protein [Acidobacteriota bacterium]
MIDVVSDYEQITSYRVPAIPTLMIGGDVTAAGTVPGVEELSDAVRSRAQLST